MSMPDTTATGQREPQMNQEINALERVVTSMSESIGELRQRLNPIMRAEPQTAPEAADLEALVPHADSIRGCRTRLEGQLVELSEMLRLVEV